MVGVGGDDGGVGGLGELGNLQMRKLADLLIQRDYFSMLRLMPMPPQTTIRTFWAWLNAS